MHFGGVRAAAKALTETAQVADRKHMSGMPCGTLAANVLACIGVFVLASTRTYSCSPPPQGFALPAWCAGALAVGLMGSLSTVSTFIAEVCCSQLWSDTLQCPRSGFLSDVQWSQFLRVLEILCMS